MSSRHHSFMRDQTRIKSKQTKTKPKTKPEQKSEENQKIKNKNKEEATESLRKFFYFISADMTFRPCSISPYPK